MSLSADDIIRRIMERAVDTNAADIPGTALKRYHVSQTADQLPDFRIRNAFYRSELERQIQEKREAERRRKEREVLEEERILRKIETDREKIRREYLEEIEKRNQMQEEAERRQQVIAKRLEEIHEVEERKRDEEEKRRRQQAMIEKRIAELKEAVEKRKAEEAEKRRQRILFEKLYGTPFREDSRSRLIYGDHLTLNSAYYKRPWNSRDYVHSALQMQPDLILEDVYFEAPLPVLADVYKKLDNEKRRIKEIMKQRIVQGEI